MKVARQNFAQMFAERVETLIQKYGVVGLSRIADVSEGTVRSWKRGGSMKIEHAVSIHDETGVSLEWLMTGRGEMHASDVDHPEEPEKLSEFALIPKYDVEIAAGHGRDPGEETVDSLLAFRRDWLNEEGLDARFAALLTARGDSQQGFIEDGDSVFIDLRYRDYVGEGVYAIRVDQDIMLKRVQRMPDGALHIMSKNPEYATIVVGPRDLDQVQFIGCLVWRGSRIPHPKLPAELKPDAEAE